ncbi:MAG: ornithine aminomutase subunit alpha [Clostridiales bacterium]|nr:ornithine aminomutase subunit alpha [Clostridiales bacterium]
MKREDDFQERRAHLAQLSDDELHARFWELANAAVAPLLELGRENTSPSIERSVLLRMGFSSLEAKPIVDAALERGLLCHGAGHIVYRYAKHAGLDIRGAGLALAADRGWDVAAGLFEGGMAQ